MPAAAVIPAPNAYIKIVAVKKLVVGYLMSNSFWGIDIFLCWCCLGLLGSSYCFPQIYLLYIVGDIITLKK